MAISNTELLQVQAAATTLLQKPENRDRNFGVFEKLWDGRATLFPYLSTPEGARTLDPEAGVSSAKVALFENKGDSVGTTRTTDHSGSALSTVTDTLTWATVSQAFSVSMKDSDSNFFKKPEQMAQGFLTARQKCLAKINADSLAFLESKKSGVTAVTTYPITDVSVDDVNDIHNVAKAGEDLFFSIASTIMDVNDYGNFGIDFIHDYNLKQLALNFFNQGANNDVNKQYQIADNFNYASALIGATETQKGLGYLFPTGSVAAITAIPKANRRGAEGDRQLWGTYIDPVYPELIWALHVRETAENGNRPQDLRWSWELSVDYAFKASPLSNVDETVIQKIALLKA